MLLPWSSALHMWTGTAALRNPSHTAGSRVGWFSWWATENARKLPARRSSHRFQRARDYAHLRHVGGDLRRGVGVELMVAGDYVVVSPVPHIRETGVEDR